MLTVAIWEEPHPSQVDCQPFQPSGTPFAAGIKDVSSGGAGGDFAALKMEFWYADYSGYIEEVVYPEGVSSSWQQFTASYTLPAETGIIRAVLVVTGSDDGNDVAYQFDDVELNRTQLASFDMGRTYEGLTVTDSITIFNAGGSDLVITDISSDNNVFTLSASSATIALDGFFIDSSYFYDYGTRILHRIYIYYI